MTLYAAGTIISETLGCDTTDSEGNFSIKFSRPSESGIIYAIARGGTPRGKRSPNDAIALLTVIGEVDGRPDSVTLNELTTVASVWTNAQFLSGNTIIGNGTGIYNAAGNVRNIVNIETGRPGPVIRNAVNGSPTVRLRRSTRSAILSIHARRSRRQTHATDSLRPRPRPDGTPLRTHSPHYIT